MCIYRQYLRRATRGVLQNMWKHLKNTWSVLEERPDSLVVNKCFTSTALILDPTIMFPFKLKICKHKKTFSDSTGWKHSSDVLHVREVNRRSRNSSSAGIEPDYLCIYSPSCSEWEIASWDADTKEPFSSSALNSLSSVWREENWPLGADFILRGVLAASRAHTELPTGGCMILFPFNISCWYSDCWN